MRQDVERGADDGRDLQRGTRGALRILAAVALLGMLQVAALIFVELDRLTRHAGTIAELEADLAASRAEAEALRAIAERVSDTDFREHLARQQGFMFPSERRVIVVLDPRQLPPAEPPPAAFDAPPAQP